MIVIYAFLFKNEVKSTIRIRRAKLEEAFNLLKSASTNSLEQVNGKINFVTFSKLIKLADSKKSDYKIKILFDLLDLDGDNALS